MNVHLVEKRAEIARLCRAHEVQECYVFGSAATGDFVEGKSDYDFLVQFSPCSPAEHARRYFGLLETLQDLFGAAVDLVEMDAITNTHFRRSAEQSRKSIYAA